MAFASMNCKILLLSPEQVRHLCSYLTPDAVCQLEKTCSDLQSSMNQKAIWKKQVESFPVAGIPFGDSSEATYSKLGNRWDYFNWRLLKYFYSDIKPEEYGWHNPYRVALRTKFTIDKLLGDVQNFVENDLDEALGKLKEEANLHPDRDWLYRYPLKIWQVTVELDHSDKWGFQCSDYILKWMVHGQIIPGRKRVDWKSYRDKNVFKIESYVYHDELKDESDSENENVSSDDENHDTDDGEEEEDIEDFDDDSDTDEEEEGAANLA